MLFHIAQPTPVALGPSGSATFTAILSFIFTVTYSNWDLFSSVITVSSSTSSLSNAQSYTSPTVLHPEIIKNINKGINNCKNYSGFKSANNHDTNWEKLFNLFKNKGKG